MMYVALLRGVNVGGNARIDMKTLKSVFESLDLTAVKTYLNSGNVIFAAEDPDRLRITRQLEDAIDSRFGIRVRVLVRTLDEITSVVRALPAGWKNDNAMKCDVFFLWEDVDRPTILDRLDFDPAVEDVRYTPGAVIRRIDRAMASRSRLTKVVGTPLYQQMTVRNCNTARQLLKLMSG